MDALRRREEIFLMEAELHAWALSYTDDPDLADALVQHTMLKSWNAVYWPLGAVTTRTWMAELMWHTVSGMNCFDSCPGHPHHH